MPNTGTWLSFAVPLVACPVINTPGWFDVIDSGGNVVAEDLYNNWSGGFSIRPIGGDEVNGFEIFVSGVAPGVYFGRIRKTTGDCVAGCFRVVDGESSSEQSTSESASESTSQDDIFPCSEGDAEFLARGAWVPAYVFTRDEGYCPIASRLNWWEVWNGAGDIVAQEDLGPETENNGWNIGNNGSGAAFFDVFAAETVAPGFYHIRLRDGSGRCFHICLDVESTSESSGYTSTSSEGSVSSESSVGSSDLSASESSESSDVHCCPAGHYWDSTANAGAGGCVALPGVPAAPGVPRLVGTICDTGAIIVRCPAVFPSGATHLKLYRSDKPGIVLATFTLPSQTFTDTDVESPNTYTYFCTACNALGCSSAGTSLIVHLESQLEIVITSPEDADAIAGRVPILFTLADPLEVESSPCSSESSGGCQHSDVDVRLFVDTVEVLGFTVEQLNGTPRNGDYRITGFDTRDYANGARTLRIVATGSDCCKSAATVDVTFTNTLRRGIRYIPHHWTKAPITGKHYDYALVSLQNDLPLFANPNRRYWFRTAISTTPAAIAWDVGTAAELAAQFDAMQSLVLEEKQDETTPDQMQYAATSQLSVPGSAVYVVHQMNPQTLWSAEVTGLEKIAKIRAVTESEMLVFARNTDGSAAKLFRYGVDGWIGTAYDFDDYGAADAIDCTLVGDKIWIARATGDLVCADTDANQIPLIVRPFGTLPGAPVSVEVVSGKAIVIYSNGVAAAAFNLTLSAPGRVWDLAAPVSRATPIGTVLYLASANKLYSSAAGTATPALVRSFGANITAIGNGGATGAETVLVGLQNGQVWQLSAGTWSQLTTLTSAVLALADWEAAGTVRRPVAGVNDDYLREATSAGWVDSRQIEVPAGMTETVDEITALARFAVEIAPAVGSPGDMNFVAAEIELRLLIGTAADGVLMVLSLSALSEADGCFLGSAVSHLNIDPMQATIPVDSSTGDSSSSDESGSSDSGP